jgi:hypothetical protein
MNKTKSVKFATNFFTKIFDGLFISDQLASFDNKLIEANKIECFINLTKNAPFLLNSINIKVDFLNYTSKYSNLTKICCKIDSIVMCIHRLLSAKKSVLVYCENGYSKTLVFILCYLLKFPINNNPPLNIENSLSFLVSKVKSHYINNCNYLYLCSQYRNYLIDFSEITSSHNLNLKNNEEVKKSNNLLNIIKKKFSYHNTIE